MKAYLNDPALKTMMVEEAAKHRAQDQLIKGVYEKAGQGNRFQGCAVGCTIHSLNLRLGKNLPTSAHAVYETELGIPRALARIEDRIFENLPDERAKLWPEQFLAAVPVGADLSRVIDQFLHWLLVDESAGVIHFAKSDRSRKAIQTVADLYAKKLAGETVTSKQWGAAADAVAYAAYAAAAVAYAAVAYAAYAAAALKNAWVKQADKLIELLRAA